MKPKLCYILPEYDKKTATHFAHVYDFLEEIEKMFDLYIIAERGKSFKVRPFYDGQGRTLTFLRFSFPPFRALETFFVLLKLRTKGYRDFYVHYSFFSAFIASVVVQIFGGQVYYWNCGEPWKYKRGAFRDFFEKLTYRMITFLVTGTESLKKEYAEYYALPLEKIKVMPNWINLRKFSIFNFQFSIDDFKKRLNIKDEKVILFVHRLSRRKGAHYLPEIISAFKNDKVVFVIVGDGPEAKNLKFKIENIKLSDKVRLPGWVPNKDLLNYYAAADLFIMPSEEEGFPRVLLETMALEIPFVAFDVGGVREITPSELQKFILKSGDTAGFINGIKLLLNASEEELNQLKRAENNRVKKYSLENVLPVFQKLFD